MTGLNLILQLRQLVYGQGTLSLSVLPLTLAATPSECNRSLASQYSIIVLVDWVQGSDRQIVKSSNLQVVILLNREIVGTGSIIVFGMAAFLPRAQEDSGFDRVRGIDFSIGTIINMAVV